MRKTFFHLGFFAIGLAILGALAATWATGPQPAAAADAGTVALLYAGRLSNGDVEGILDLFTDDISFIGGAPCNVTACVGKASVRPRLETARATHVQLVLTGVGTSSGGTVAAGRGLQRSDSILSCGFQLM